MSRRTSLAASVACSLDLANSFRFLCESLGLSGPDDFAIPLADWEAHKAVRSSASASSSPNHHDSPHRDSPLGQVGGTEEPAAKAVDATGLELLPTATGRDGGPIEALERRPARLDPRPEPPCPDARRAAGEGGGIKGVRPPLVLKPPPSMALPNGRFRRRIRSWSRGVLLGSGSFGTVYEGISDEGVFFAVKEVNLFDKGSNAKQCIFQLEQDAKGWDTISSGRIPVQMWYMGSRNWQQKEGVQMGPLILPPTWNQWMPGCKHYDSM